MANAAEKLDNDLETLIIEANGVLLKSDSHEHPEIGRNAVEESAKRGYLLVDAGDNVNDYAFEEVMQVAANDHNYHFNSQLRHDFYVKQVESGVMTKDEFGLYQIEMISKMNGIGFDETFDYLESQGKDFNGDKFDKSDRNRLEGLLRSEVAAKKFQRIEEAFVQDEKVVYHMQRNLDLYLSFMSEEVKPLAGDLDANPNARVAMVLGNHDSLIYAALLRQQLKNPDQLILVQGENSVLTVKQDNGQEITIVGDTNCVAPMGYLEEILPPGMFQQFYAHMYRGVTEDNVIVGNISIEDLKNNYETEWYNDVVNRLGRRSLDLLVVHGPVGKSDKMDMDYDFPYLGDVAKLSLKAKKVVHGHNHMIYDGKTPFGTDTSGVAGEQGLIVYKDSDGNMVEQRIKLGSNYGDGMSNPLLKSAEFYIEKAAKMREEAANDSFYDASDFANAA